MVCANIICLNELLYLKNLIPQLKDMCDEVYIVDGGSVDGSVEWLKENAEKYNIRLFHREWDWDFGAQREFLLNQTPKDNWVIRLDCDEIPSAFLRFGLKQVLMNLGEYPKSDRIRVPIFHLHGGLLTCGDVGGRELRIFWHDDSTKCHWLDKTHTRLDGRFKTGLTDFKDEYGLIHLKYLDEIKIERSRKEYVNHGTYHPDHLEKLIHPENLIELPKDVMFFVSKELREYLCV